MDDFLRVASYARVSSERQAEEFTIQSQVAALRERIVADGLRWENDRSFLDEGYSGSTLMRPALERLRDLAHSGGIDRLYVHSPDRLARKYVYQVLLLEEFRRHEVEVVFLNDIAASDSPEGQLLTQMQGMFAEFERAKILERTRRGKRFAARQGQVSALGHAPYGYRYVAKSEGGGVARYEVVADQAALVAAMFRWVGVEGLSLGEVSRRLQEQGVPTVTGQSRWDRATIRGLLVNPAYVGTATFGKTRLMPRTTERRAKRGDPPTPRREKVARRTATTEHERIAVPALVSEALFAAVAEKLSENRRRYREQKKGAEFLLSGLLVCERCGAAYCGRRHRSRTKAEYVYYRCLGTDKFRHGGVTVCANASVNGQVEEAVWSDVCSLLQEPERLQTEFARRLENPASEQADQQRLQEAIAQTKRRMTRLLDAYEGELIDKQELERRLPAAREKLRRQEQELAEHQQAAFAADELRLVVSEFASFAEQMSAGLSDADFATQRRLLKLLVKRIEINAEEIRIVYKVPLRPFATSPRDEGVLQDWLKFHTTPSA